MIIAVALLMTILALKCMSAVPTEMPKSTPMSKPTPAPTLIPTQISGRADLYETVFPPEHMAYIWWNWDRPGDEFRELQVDFTLHNDPSNFSSRQGLYLMVCFSSISDQNFYFGLQTNTYDPGQQRGRGKALIFSRWGERDLSFARIADSEQGWYESSGHEGNFIGVRRSYDWTTGDYQMRLAPDGKDDNGEWYGVWITDLATDITTWAGSLKFPLVNGTTVVSAPTYTTLEIYGNPIRPIDIPEWHVSVQRPIGNGIRSNWGNSGYSGFMRGIHNSDVQYDPETDSMQFRMGGATERVGSTQPIQFP